MRHKYLIFQSLFLFVLLPISAERFACLNDDGILLWYSTLSDSTVMLTGSESDYDIDIDELNYAYISADTIRVPEYASNGEKRYKVVQLNSDGVFCNIQSLTTIYLPKTIELIGDTMSYTEITGYFPPNTDQMTYDISLAFVALPNLENIYVDSANTAYASIDGVVYTKDLRNIIAYPSGRKETSYSVLEGCEHIGRHAFYRNENLRKLDFPNSLISIGNQALKGFQNIDTIFLKDSVEYIGKQAMLRRSNNKISALYLGRGITKIRDLFDIPSARNIYCYSLIPPDISSYYITNDMVLYVPRQSYNLYAEHKVWGNFPSMVPIEPPIVSTSDGATISWVQDFSATRYMVYIYADESHEQLVMTLTFNNKGLLVHIHVENINLIPTRLPQLSLDELTDDKQFAEFYSFTISGLKSNQTYYYVHQTLNGSVVLSQQEGSFTTLRNISTEDEYYSPIKNLPSKQIRDGQLIILNKDYIYDVRGNNQRY